MCYLHSNRLSLFLFVVIFRGAERTWIFTLARNQLWRNNADHSEPGFIVIVKLKVFSGKNDLSDFRLSAYVLLA